MPTTHHEGTRALQADRSYGEHEPTARPTDGDTAAQPDVIGRLRGHVAGLRRGAGGRTLVSQAKGIAVGLLAERLGVGTGEALDQLRRFSREAGTGLVRAAALLLRQPATGDIGVAAGAGGRVPAGSRTSPTVRPGTGDAGSPGDADVRALLEVVPAPAALLTPVRDDHGRVVDFVVGCCNAEALDPQHPQASRLTGRRLLGSSPAHPGLAAELFDTWVKVLDTGLPDRRGPFELSGVTRDGRAPVVSVRAARLGDAVLVSWRYHNEEERLALQLAQAQRLGNIGWAEWYLHTNEIVWSDQVYEIFGRDRAAGPMTLDRLPAYVLADDLPVVEQMARTLLGRGEPTEGEFRIVLRGRIRHLYVMAEPVVDGFGQPVSVRAVVQDVTTRRRAEEALAASRELLAVQRQRAAEERHAALELQRAILPTHRGPIHLPGARVAVRYLPARSDSRVGGDWYEATPLPDGRVLVAIGDVAGHGLPAAAGMARLRNALTGLAITGQQPDRLVGWLNELLCHDSPEATASAVVAHFDPRSRTLVWAQAGHPPPVLLRAGDARPLDPPRGTLLGASARTEYRRAKVRLEPGDLVLLYTDGLIERRHADITDGIDALLAAVRRCSGEDPERDLDALLGALGSTDPEDDTCVLALAVQG